MWSNTNTKKKPYNPETDSFLLFTEAVLKWLLFFLIQPYKGLWHRLNENKWHYHLGNILLLECVGWAACRMGLIRYLFDKTNHTLWVYVIPFSVFLHGKLILAILIAHTYCFIWRIPQLRKENLTNQAFEKIGMIPSANPGKIKLICDQPGEGGRRHLWLTNPGLPLEEYTSRRSHFEAMLKLYITDISFGSSTYRVCITYRTRPFPNVIKYEEFIFDRPRLSNQFGIGLSLNGEKIVTSLKDMVHLLVAGETGGGKSTFLRQLIVDLINSTKPVSLYLVDLKGGVEFQPFKNYKNVCLVKETSELSEILKHLNQELDRRLKLLEEAMVCDLSDYEEREKISFPRIVLIIDECAEIFIRSSYLSTASKMEQDQIRVDLSRLARLSRAVGIHLVLATQRADKQAVDMQIKDNLVSRLCFRVSNDYTSQMVLRDGAAARLPNVKGRGIWKCGNEEVELQVPYLAQADIDRHCIARKEVA